MSWLRIEGRMPQHRKVAPLSDAAFRLHITAMAWCVEELTDGAMPAKIPQTLTAAPRGKQLTEVIAELLEAGLWVRAETGYVIHDFLDWNPSAETVRAKRDAAKERMNHARSRSVRANTERTQSEVPSNEERSSQTVRLTPIPTPIPIPIPNPEEVPSGTSIFAAPGKPARKAKPRSAVDPDSGWDGDQREKLERIGRNPDTENSRFIAHHQAKGTLSASWRASRNTWVLNAESGYGASVTHIRPANRPGESGLSPAMERLKRQAMGLED